MFFVTAICCSPVLAEDWAVSRGDTAATGVSETVLPDSLDVRWKYVARDSAFEAEPVVAGGIVYIGDADGTVHAIRLDDGEGVWKKQFSESGFTAAGAVANQCFYVGDIYGVVRCLSIDTGEVLWESETESEVFAGPYVYEGLLLVTTEGGTLYAFDANTGDESWRFSIEAPLRCSPTIVGNHTLLAGCDERLHAIDLSTGQEIGSVNIGGPTGSTAAASDGIAYFGTEAGVFYAIDSKNPAEMAVAWTYRDPRRGQGIRSAAAIGESVVVYGSNGKAIYGIDRQSGKQVWQKPVRSRVESSPVIVRVSDGSERAIAATARGRILLLNVANGEVVWEYDAGGGFSAAPAAIDNKLLIGNTDGTLYCFGKKD